jgi:uncharacterized membrane protein
MDLHTTVLFLLRWVHFIAGITWIGLLYFFNFVNAPLAKTYDADTKRKVVPELMPRALFFFRWGAMVTFLVGWIYLFWKLYVASDAGMRGEGGLLTSTWGQWISIGAILGSVMWFNVWFIIWPAQKKIISAVKNGTAPDAKLVNNATLASRTNVYLSIPMLFCMAAASHLPVFNPVLVIAAAVVALALAHHMLKLAPNAGKMNW